VSFGVVRGLGIPLECTDTVPLDGFVVVAIVLYVDVFFDGDTAAGFSP
jgi:hypothetical protein